MCMPTSVLRYIHIYFNINLHIYVHKFPVFLIAFLKVSALEMVHRNVAFSHKNI